MIFPGKYNSLPAIGEFISQVAREAGFNEDDVYAVELAVDEACTNIIEHSYAGRRDGEITCSCFFKPDGLEIILRDTGKSFDPENVPLPDSTQPLEKLSARGAGLYLMRKMMDEVKFEFNPKTGNVLSMFKRMR
jgi:serine/threonine-protein kinase RsbW